MLHRLPASIVAIAVCLALVGPATARTVELVSAGNPAPGAAGVRGLTISRDGAVALFETSEPLGPGEPADGFADWYARVLATGALHRVTLGGPTFGDGNLIDLSDDGTRLWYESVAQETPADTDVGTDVYELRLAADPADDVRRLVSAGSADTPALVVGGTADGSVVAYRTSEDLDGAATGDADVVSDVYATTDGGAPVLLTPGTAVGLTSARLLRDGSRLRFETTESLVAADQDGTLDVYDVPVAGGPYRLVSSWPGTTFQRVTEPVTGRLWVSIADPLVAADQDATRDVYEIAPDGTPRLLSPGGAGDVSLERVSADGHVAMITDAALLPADQDGGVAGAGSDLYVAAPDGTLRLASGGSDPSATVSIFLLGEDGGVLFFTSEPLLPEDGTEGEVASDLYLRTASGELRLLTPGTLASGAYFPTEAFAEPEAARPVFAGPDLPGTDDVNGKDDLYELTPDGPRKVGPAALARGEAGPSASLLEEAPAVSADGSRILFRTLDALPGSEDATNVTFDAYLVTWEAPRFAGPPAATGSGRVGQTLTCAPQAATGDERIDVTVAWLRDGVAIPGATQTTRVVAPADAGAALVCRATAAGPAGSASADSAPIQIAPTADATALAGFPILGTRLACTTFTGADTTTYRWLRGTTAVAGQTARTYLIGAADLGKRLTCEATASAGPGAVTTATLRRPIPRTCLVPRLRGRPRADAVRGLRERGCRAATRSVVGRGVARGQVLRTSPAAGSRVPNGTVVTAYVRR